MNERTNHTTGANGAVDDEFESLARGAGAELRRQAPAGGADAIRAVRRRQQRTRTLAATGVAATLAIALVAGAVLRGDDEPAVVVQPTAPSTPTMPSGVPTPTSSPAPTVTAPLTTPDTTPDATPETSAPVTVPPGTTAGLSEEAVAWRDARAAEGLTNVDVFAGQGTDARLLNAYTPDNTSRLAAVLLADGRVVALPDGLGEIDWAIYALGGRPAVLDLGPAADGATVAVWQLDPATLTWTTTGDLGLGGPGTSFYSSTTATVVDDLLVVTNNALDNLDDSTIVLSPKQRGVVVLPDLSYTPMAPAPSGVPLHFGLASGGKALQMYGLAVEGGVNVDVTDYQPWQYDPRSNEWSEIPIPEWMDCPAEAARFECAWVIPPDVGQTMLDEATDRGIVARVPDGTVGLYDAATSTWTRMDDPPFALVMPATAVVGDQVVVAPWRAGDNDFTLIGVLDVAAGTWTTHHVEIPADVASRFGNEWFDVSWDLRVTGTRVLAAPGPSFQQSPLDPLVAYDTATRTWSAPTADDVVAWRSLTIDLST